MNNFFSRMTIFSKVLFFGVIFGLAGLALYLINPGVIIGESKEVSSILVDATDVDNEVRTSMRELASDRPSKKIKGKPPVSIAAYAWNAQSGIIGANGGPMTTQGSLMEANGVNLFFQRRDSWSDLQTMHMGFVSEFDKGKAFPNPQKGVFGVIIMGDGAPMYISEMQKTLDDSFGEGTYHMEVAGAVGISAGEDKLIGPPIWKKDPQQMRGSLIATVVGDGDWVTVVNYCAANGIPINPNSGTYDENAVNFFDSEDGDYLNSARELVKSQLQGWTVPLKVMKDGKLTSETIDKKIDGCATWTPGDVMVYEAFQSSNKTFVDIVSTKEFNNQMPTTLIVLREWAQNNKDIVSNILKSSYQSANQMKQYDEWARRNAKAVSITFDEKKENDGVYWYELFKGTTGTKGGHTYNMGGSRVFNLADAKEYYGITGYLNRYEAVYDQVGKYLVDLSPMDFMGSVGKVVPYSEAVNLEYIKAITNIESGTAFTEEYDYSTTATELVASREWKITFGSASAQLTPESRNLLDEAYNLIVQAENTRIEVEGHTDSQGPDESNLTLSEQRAKSVQQYLQRKQIPTSRFQRVEGLGETMPVADNATRYGRAQNRRVVITLLQ